MSVVVLAYQEIGFACLEALLDMGAKVDLLLTHEDDPDEDIWFRSPAALARERGVPVITPENPNTPDILATVERLKPDFILSFYYRYMLHQEFLDLAARGAYNLHGSLLPQYRGRAPINWAILKGEPKTGITLHRMVRRPDAGAIVAQVEVEIFESDSVRDVYARIVPAAGRLIRDVWPGLLRGEIREVPQDEAEASYYGRRRPEDGRLDWKGPARDVHNLVRAVTRPYPGAFCFHKGKKLFIWAGRYEPDQDADQEPGTVLEVDQSKGVAIAAGQGRYIIREASIENRDPSTDPEMWGLREKDVLQ